MIKFKTLSLRNFLCFGNVPTVVNLDQPGTTLVQGQNLDNTDQGTGNNGTGKTTLINALSYAVYDKPIADISKDNLVNNINKKNMEVTIEFEKGKHHYLIKRARKMKAGAGGNYVQLFKDQKDITPDSAKHTNSEIEQIMGIPYELFVRIVAFSATHIPFLDLPVRSPTAANQTDIIEELFDLKTLSEKAETLKEKIKDTEQSLQMQQNRVEQLEKEHERHEKQLENAQKRVDNWEQERKTQIEQLKEKIKRVENVDIDGQKKLHDDLYQIDAELKQTTNTQQNVQRQIEDQHTITNNKSDELKHLRDEKCPYCLQKYQDAHNKIKQCEQELEHAQTAVRELQEELTQVDTQIENLTTQHEQTKQQITVKDLDELIDIKNKIDVYQNQLQELQTGENPYTEPLEELKQVELEQIDMSYLNGLKDTLDHQKFLLKLLTKKDSFVRKALLNKNLPFLNQRLAYYLSELGLPHTVEFTHEMTASISQFGSPLDFGSLSNGQRARVNLALSFAFRDVLQSMHEYINVCMLDEALDVGLDTVGVQNAARMIKQKARDEGLSVYVISHRDEIENAFDYNTIVKMSKGFSYIEYDQ